MNRFLAVVLLPVALAFLSHQEFEGPPPLLVDDNPPPPKITWPAYPSPRFSPSPYSPPLPFAGVRTVDSYVADGVPPLEFTTGDVFREYLVWGGADYALWWFRKAPLAVPLVVTTSSAPGPGANIIGIDPNARVILGPQQIEQDPNNGGRIWLGFWFDCNRSLGVEVIGLWVESPSQRMGVQSTADGSPLLSRPIVMPGNVPGVYDIGYPTAVRGNFFMQSHQLLRGLEANFVGFAYGNHRFAFDILAGARFIDLEEQLNLHYQVNNLVPMPAFGGAMLAPGVTVGTVDSYRTTNQFYGGQLGARAEGNFGRLSLALTGKIAFGVNDATLNIDGRTTRSDAATTYPAGILANAANIGRYRDSHYAFVPEGNLSVGWWFTPNLRMKVGYNVLYISDVLRPGNHISNAVNPSAVPVDQIYGSTPVTRTSPQFLRSDFWAEGITFGIDFRY